MISKLTMRLDPISEKNENPSLFHVQRKNPPSSDQKSQEVFKAVISDSKGVAATMQGNGPQIALSPLDNSTCSNPTIVNVPESKEREIETRILYDLKELEDEFLMQYGNRKRNFAETNGIISRLLKAMPWERFKKVVLPIITNNFIKIISLPGEFEEGQNIPVYEYSLFFSLQTKNYTESALCEILKVYKSTKAYILFRALKHAAGVSSDDYVQLRNELASCLLINKSDQFDPRQINTPAFFNVINTGRVSFFCDPEKERSDESFIRTRLAITNAIADCTIDPKVLNALVTRSWVETLPPDVKSFITKNSASNNQIGPLLRELVTRAKPSKEKDELLKLWN